MDDLLTTRQIAKKMNTPLWRVQYFVSSRNIKPVRSVGVYRLFAPSVIDLLQTELDAVDARKTCNLTRGALTHVG